MNINTINHMSGTARFGGVSQTGGAQMAAPKDVKSVLDGDGLTISYAKSNPLEDLQKTEDVEEPVRGDALSQLVKDAYKDYLPPPIPTFV